MTIKRRRDVKWPETDDIPLAGVFGWSALGLFFAGIALWPAELHLKLLGVGALLLFITILLQSEAE